MARSKAKLNCPRRAAPVHTEYLGSFLYYEEFVQVATNECGTNDMWEVSICVVLSSFVGHFPFFASQRACRQGLTLTLIGVVCRFLRLFIALTLTESE